LQEYSYGTEAKREGEIGMSQLTLRVLVIGGGLGGLCLAQALHQAGVDVAVYERDASPIFRGQGYRIHIDSRGEQALQECLPPRLYELFAATRGQASRQITIFTVDNKELKEAQVWPFPEGDSPVLIRAGSAVDRLTLRQILLAGLDDIVHFNKEFTRYEKQDDGRVRAYFTDGTSAIGDVLVAADGVGSRVRQQFLPHAQIIDLGVRWIGGKTILTDEIIPLLPVQLYEGFATVAGSNYSMVLGLVRFLQRPDEAAAQLWPGLRFHHTHDYIMWGLLGRREQLPIRDEELQAMDGVGLQQVAVELTKGWHPTLHTLTRQADPEESFVLTMRSSVPIEHWQTGNVTLLGDAIHAMSPSRGSGGNTALRDASLLSRSLIAVARQSTPLHQALHDYEIEIVRYGFDAVRASLQGGGRAPFPLRSDRAAM